ncbi:hypothetical protein RH831_08800 [Halodesulfurarchaeum sp. HSR-GB]|uniref:hypothetical protein n=1 Tax=Halodesulfurarchaeum sp. HSR-GB TaxID=3074077 RepID=UPI00285F56B4|nr:hypothetical protein [Halodesulfurarchaeum sp. HSR-GB]MDR5657277.1 hypothetical protein [Halodesulfurarchaeum sp. HSR-GB]
MYFNEPETLEERLEGVEESRLEGAPGRASDGVAAIFEKVSGEILIDEPGSPDRNDYDEQKLGYEKYLNDLHEWALSNYREKVEKLAKTVANLEAQEYPELGMQRLEDEEVREDSEDLIVEAKAAHLEVVEWRQKLAKIEEGFGDRP